MSENGFQSRQINVNQPYFYYTRLLTTYITMFTEYILYLRSSGIIYMYALFIM
jgi:hypothetical protein